MESFDYSDELLGMVGLDREHMCELSAPGEVIGELKEDAAREVGLPAGLAPRGRCRRRPGGGPRGEHH
jgi:sugar (pentulose or hexulose) kinase